jgi:hypothetical protein
MAKTSIYPRTQAVARRLLILFAALCLAVPLIPPALAAVPSAPFVYMSMTRRDFGDVFAGEEIEQSFAVRNDGDAPLEMQQKSLTGQAAPITEWMRAAAFYGGSPVALKPVALRRAAPS